MNPIDFNMIRKVSLKRFFINAGILNNPFFKILQKPKFFMFLAKIFGSKICGLKFK
jgi:hypothetical protein